MIVESYVLEMEGGMLGEGILVIVKVIDQPWTPDLWTLFILEKINH